MVDPWPWYVGGVVLATVPVLHWLGLRRTMSVSGRFSALINRLRFGPPPPDTDMSADEMVRAIQEATAAAFGAEAVQGPETRELPPRVPSRTPLHHHIVFLGALVLGGFVSVMLSGGWEPAMRLDGVGFSAIFGESRLVAAAILGAGGVLVGFGTRMAGGCTTGHGLCGVSRFHRASLAATGAFFGSGVVVSMLLRGLA